MTVAPAPGTVPSPPPGDPLLIHGEESFLVDRDQRAWLGAARAVSLTELDVEIIEQPARLDGVHRSLTEIPFLAPRRHVLLRDPPQLAERQRRGGDGAGALAELIALRAPTTALCIVAHGRVAATNPVPAAVRAAGGRVVEHARLKARDQRAWLDRAVAARGLRLPRGAADHLLSVSGGDLGVLDSELSKLIAYAGGRPVSDADVRALAAGSEHLEIWDVVERLLTAPHHGGPAAADALLAGGVATMQLISVLGGQLRELLQAHEVLAAGGRGSGPLAGRLGIPPWRADRLVRWSSMTTPAMVEGWLRELQRIDAGMKLGLVDDAAALRALMLRAARQVSARVRAASR
jgi:DNA polymerase-3 subunit delta